NNKVASTPRPRVIRNSISTVTASGTTSEPVFGEQKNSQESRGGGSSLGRLGSYASPSSTSTNNNVASTPKPRIIRNTISTGSASGTTSVPLSNVFVFGEQKNSQESQGGGPSLDRLGAYASPSSTSTNNNVASTPEPTIIGRPIKPLP